MNTLLTLIIVPPAVAALVMAGTAAPGVMAILNNLGPLLNALCPPPKD